jgi:hypothetical protein
VKSYEPPWRGPNCPTGRHEKTDPSADQPGPYNEECDCAWLTVASNTPVSHVTTWNRRELENLIREMDNGHFDPAHFPPRQGASRFMSPDVQRVLEQIQAGDRLGAVQTLLGAMTFDQVMWDPQSGCLSLRRTELGELGFVHEWLQLWLKGGQDRGQYSARGDEAGGDPDTIDGLWSEDTDPPPIMVGGFVLSDNARAQLTAAVQPAADEAATPLQQHEPGWRDEPLPLGGLQ